MRRARAVSIVLAAAILSASAAEGQYKQLSMTAFFVRAWVPEVGPQIATTRVEREMLECTLRPRYSFSRDGSNPVTIARFRSRSVVGHRR